jgi:hypothetical protein
MIDGQSLMGGHGCGTKLMCGATGNGVDHLPIYELEDERNSAYLVVVT